MEKVRNIKTLLAKLMATENITVQHQAVQTASFDPVNRVLTIPVYKDDLSNDELDLFVGHEVGHALFTPSAPIETYVKGRKYFKEFLNIVEDARIEKLIQRRFPGLRKNFVGGYNGLIERGFFGDKDPNDFNFIDRINVYFKTGDTRIEFSDEEQVFVDAIKNLEDWDSTIDLTEKLFEYCGAKGQEKEEEDLQQQMSSQTGSPDDNDDQTESEETQSSDEQSNNSSDEEEKGQGESDEDGDDQSNEQSTADTDDDGIEENKSSEDQGVNGDEEMKSQTTIDFEKGMQELVDNSIGNVYEASLYKVPTQVTSIDEIYKLIQESIYGGNGGQFVNYFDVERSEDIETKLVDLHSEFVCSQKSVLNYMVKEFEMKKKADEYKRTREAKTGTLNMSKLYNYKFSEDLFLKNNITKDGKSHGMVMLVDWSGSMYGQIEDVLQQVQILTAFCQKVNIPFDVYAFTDQMTDQRGVGYEEEYEEGWRLGHGFSLLHLASSSFNRNQKELSNKALAFFKKIFSRSSQYGTIMMNRMERQLQLGQTPLASGLLSMFPILTQFQNRTHVDILNLVCLTDGEGQCRINFDQGGKRGALSYGWSRGNDGFILKGNKADYRIKSFGSDDECSFHRPISRGGVHRYNLVETNLYDILRKEFENLRITGFYLAENDRQALYRIYNSYVVDTKDCIDKYKENGPIAVKSYKEKKFLKVNADVYQYDNLFIVKGSSLDLDDTWEVDEKTVKSTAKLRKSFSKMMKSKVSDRVLASNFIEVIA